jgi:sRNA-binding carbon storage regulator CsrA
METGVESDMQGVDDTIGYAIKIGDEIEIRILNASGEQTRLALNDSKELFANPEKLHERIDAEKHSQAA